MSIKEKLNVENEESLIEWRIKREVGLVKYFIVGFIKFVIFSTAIQIVGCLIEGKIKINWTEIFVIIAISIVAPLISWCANEYRYNKYL